MDDRRLGSVPDGTILALEQVRLVGLRFRVAGAALLALGLLTCAGFVWYLNVVSTGVIATRNIKLAAMSAHARATLDHPLSPMHVSFSPAISIVVVVLALLLPLAVWQDEAPGQRGYHLVMPVRASTHTLLRVLAGWAWLMAITILYLAAFNIVPALVQLIPGALPWEVHYMSWWEWLVPFTAVTVAYVYASAAAVGARRPLIWMGAPIIAFVAAVMLLQMLDMPDESARVLRIVTGFYGLAAAMAGQVDLRFGVPSLARWLGATAIWGFVGAALLVATARRRVER